jgi:hypothetical protein
MLAFQQLCVFSLLKKTQLTLKQRRLNLMEYPIMQSPTFNLSLSVKVSSPGKLMVFH